jgi:hypothetical protein
MKNKYNIGDLIVLTVSNRTYKSYITWLDEENIELFHFDNDTTNVYYRDIVDRWISDSNSKHYPVKDEK